MSENWECPVCKRGYDSDIDYCQECSSGDDGNIPRPDIITKLLIRFFLKPIFSYVVFDTDQKRDYRLFNGAFWNRSIEQSKVIDTIMSNESVIIEGSPGQGKSCFLHKVFVELESNGSGHYPIIIDYREIRPKGPCDIKVAFIEQMRYFFKEIIDMPIKDLQQRTTKQNCEDAWNIVARHLQQIRLEDLKKKPIILLDDFDYADDTYLPLITEFFSSYGSNNGKALIILSARKPLINSIKGIKRLKQAYRVNSRVIPLSPINVDLLLQYRLSLIWEGELKYRMDESLRDSFMRLAFLMFKISLKCQGVNNRAKFVAYFPKEFYSRLHDYCNGNIGEIEVMFKKYLDLFIGKPTDWTPNQFCDNYIDVAHECDLLLDLVSHRTSNSTVNRKVKQRGIPILKTVLEFFLLSNTVGGDFDEIMKEWGISREEAHRSIEILSGKNFCLLEPDYIYNANGDGPEVLKERYFLNEKSNSYLRHILKREKYYDLIGSPMPKYSLLDEIEKGRYQ